MSKKDKLTPEQALVSSSQILAKELKKQKKENGDKK